MNTRPLATNTVSIASALLILLLALALDGLIEYLKAANGATFSLTPVILWVYPISDLILAGCIFSLFRHLYSHSMASRVAYLAILALGVVALLYLPIASLFVNIAPLGALLTLKLKLIYSGAFLALGGAVGTLRPDLTARRV